MDDEIKLDLDKECTRLLVGVKGQKNSVLRITQTMGIGYPHLVPFVLGIVYAELQRYFKDLYVTKGIAQEDRLRTDWNTYWKGKYTSLSDELKTIYGL